MQGYTPKTPTRTWNLPRPPKARRRGLGYKKPVKYALRYSRSDLCYLLCERRENGSWYYIGDTAIKRDYGGPSCFSCNRGVMQYSFGGLTCTRCGYKQMSSKETGWTEYPKAKNMRKICYVDEKIQGNEGCCQSFIKTVLGEISDSTGIPAEFLTTPFNRSDLHGG